MKSGENCIGPGDNNYGKIVEGNFVEQEKEQIEPSKKGSIIIVNNDYTQKGKPVHVKPAFYAYNYEPLKAIALKYGYNLVLHGSLNRDMDLIAIPWGNELGDRKEMIKEFCSYMDGRLMSETEQQHQDFINAHHGRENYVINLNRTIVEGTMPYEYHSYYLDISITPIIAPNDERSVATDGKSE